MKRNKELVLYIHRRGFCLPKNILELQRCLLIGVVLQHLRALPRRKQGFELTSSNSAAQVFHILQMQALPQHPRRTFGASPLSIQDAPGKSAPVTNRGARNGKVGEFDTKLSSLQRITRANQWRCTIHRS
jgi:hypothetical protein